MAVQFNSVNWNRVLIDICTQQDFLKPGSILQVANVEALIPNLREVFAWARSARIPVVSSVESHRATEPANGFPMHCIDGTSGQAKLDFTLISPWVLVETDNYLSLPPGLRKKYHQLIFRKRTHDVLSNPKADRFLTQLKAEEFIIFGVGIERAIKSLALGLLARHKRVAVVTDACGCWSAGDAELATRQLGAKGIRLLTAAELVEPEPAPKRSGIRARRMRRRHHSARSSLARRTRSGAAKR